MLALLFGLVAVAPSTAEATSSELVKLAALAPAGVRAFLAGTAQLLTVALPITILGFALWRRRFRELLLVGSSALVACGAMALIESQFDKAEPTETLQSFQFDSWLTDASFPSILYLAGLTAAITAASPLLDRPWRRAGWVAVASAVVVRLLTATQAPVGLLVTVFVGAAAASLVLVVLGAPARRPGSDQLSEAARRAGLVLTGFTPHEVYGREGRWFHCQAGGGSDALLKYVDGDERDADLLYRLWRTIRVKGIEDTGTSTAPAAAVSHEAMMTMLASSAGVGVPEVLGVSETDQGAVLVLTRPPGITLAAIGSGTEPDGPDDASDGSTIRDETLVTSWRQIDLLHRRRIAHRQLDAHHVLVDGSQVTIDRFRWSGPAASDDLIAVDIADFLTATAALVGVERAVRAARSVIGDDRLAAALPYLQPLALASANKKAARADKDLLGALRDLVTEETGADDVEMAELQRIGIQQIIGVLGFGVLMLFLLGLIDNWDDIVQVFQEANWTDVPVMVVLVLLTNVAGAVSLIGAVTRPLPLGDTTTVMFGQSFLNRFTPANAGGMAMRIRYLQKGGTDLTLGTAAVGLTSVASGVVQTVFLVLFVTWGGTTDTGIEAEQPSWGVVVAVVAVLLICAFVVAVVPKLRVAVMQVLRNFTSKIRDEFGELLTRPGKLAALFGGATVSKLLMVETFVLACRAFDIDIGWAQLASAYMVGTTIASAVPTPGGVGAVEAALVLMLTGLGVDQAVAWSATLLFRLISYWMPIIPGAIGYKLSQRRELV